MSEAMFFMHLKARERIQKLREAEDNLKRIHNDLKSRDKEDNKEAMSEFLTHHKQLMSLPGSKKDSVALGFTFDTPKMYAEMSKTKAQKLTLPPKLDSSGRFRKYKDPMTMVEDATDGPGSTESIHKHPSLGVHSLLHELALQEKDSKTTTAYPKVDKFALSNNTQFSKSVQPHNSQRYVVVAPGGGAREAKSAKQMISNPTSVSLTKNTSSTALLFVRDQQSRGATNMTKDSGNFNKSKTLQTAASSSSNAKPSQAKLKKASANFSSPEQHHDSSRPASATASVLLENSDSQTLPPSSLAANVGKQRPQTARSNQKWHFPKDSSALKLKKSLAYGIGTANLMGVIMPSDKTRPNKKKSGSGQGVIPIKAKPNKEVFINENTTLKEERMTAYEAVNLLKRRNKFPERNALLMKKQEPLPHQRGLVGVEITEFDPECSFFFRDRSGNYNPHIFHSKAVTESMKKQNKSYPFGNRKP